MSKQDKIMVSDVAFISARGASIQALWESIEDPQMFSSHADYRLNSFKAAPYMSDRRVLKAVSQRDSYGLAAVENLQKQIGLKDAGYGDYEKGMFVGASASEVQDNQNYLEAIKATQISAGVYDEAEFGKHCLSARPTTLLLGLPNNVLCYGSMITQAKGLNNNFTSSEISSVLALRSAQRGMRLGRIGCGLVGGYSALTEPFMTKLRRKQGILACEGGEALELEPAINAPNSAVFADAAAFTSLEFASKLEKRQIQGLAELLGADIISSGEGLITAEGWSGLSDSFSQSLQQLLQNSGAKLESLALVMLNFSGIVEIDQTLLQCVRRATSTIDHKVAGATISRHAGNLQEASCIADFAIAKRIMDEGRVPKAIAVSDVAPDFTTTPVQGKDLVLSVVATETGDLGFVLFRKPN